MAKRRICNVKLEHTNMRQTSLDAYESEQPTFNAQERCIMNLLTVYNPKTLTRRQIASKLGMETATVSARVNALLKKGAVARTPARRCPLSGKCVEGIRVI